MWGILGVFTWITLTVWGGSINTYTPTSQFCLDWTQLDEIRLISILHEQLNKTLHFTLDAAESASISAQ